MHKSVGLTQKAHEWGLHNSESHCTTEPPDITSWWGWRRAIKIIIIAMRSPLCDNNDFRFRAEICQCLCGSTTSSICMCHVPTAVLRLHCFQWGSGECEVVVERRIKCLQKTRYKVNSPGEEVEHEVCHSLRMGTTCSSPDKTQTEGSTEARVGTTFLCNQLV